MILTNTVEALSYKTDVKARAQDSVNQKKDAVINKVTGIKEAIVGSASDEGSTVGDRKDALVSTISDATPSTDDVRRAGKGAVSLAQDNPLGLAIGAAAVGFIAALPSTRIEDEKLGEMASQVKGTIKETGQQALEHGKQVAQEVAQVAGETASQSAQEHGKQLQEAAGANAQEVTSTSTDGGSV